jgi:2C-methyl-D-erythritol 2,4-cyclodiphosphate synthase
MYILDKLNKQIKNLLLKINLLKDENNGLRNIIFELENQNDKLKYNNENMLLNIDKALSIANNPIKEENI